MSAFVGVQCHKHKFQKYKNGHKSVNFEQAKCMNISSSKIKRTETRSQIELCHCIFEPKIKMFQRVVCGLLSVKCTVFGGTLILHHTASFDSLEKKIVEKIVFWALPRYSIIINDKTHSFRCQS